jgi:hypothetical protein
MPLLKCPDLDPVESVWQFMHDNRLVKHVSTSDNDIVDHSCAAWSTVVDLPRHIISIALWD